MCSFLAPCVVVRVELSCLVILTVALTQINPELKI